MENNGKVLINLFGLKQKIDVYFKVVSGNLLCSKPVRKKFMRMLKSNVDSFLEENPNATMDDICIVFGDPYDQRNELFEEIERDYYKKLQKQVITCYVIIAVLLIILLCTIAFAMHLFYLTRPVLRFSNVNSK